MLFSSESSIKMIAMDCDGVLTDGKINISADGVEIKNFNVQDGMGIFLARKARYAAEAM